MEAAAFSSHVIVRTADGLVYSWGSGSDGRLGLGDSTNKIAPTLIEFFKDKKATQVCAGNAFSGVLLSDGSVWMFGNNGNNQLGCSAASMSNSFVPVRVSSFIILS